MNKPTHRLKVTKYTVQTALVCNIPEILDSTEFSEVEVKRVKKHSKR